MLIRSNFAAIGSLVASLALLAALGCGGENPTVSIGSQAAESPPTPAAGEAAQHDLEATRSTPPPPPAPELHPRVLIRTSAGEIELELDAEHAPITVDNFLANYVEEGFYDDTDIHYVERGKMILAGAYTKAGQMKPGRLPILNEAHHGLRNVRGSVAMARDPADRHSATSQFFFNLSDNAEFDHTDPESDEGYGYCVFGRVVAGQEVLDRISQAEVVDQPGRPRAPLTPVVIHSMRRTK